MQNQLIKTFNEKEIRIITQENGEIWFVAKDLCNALGLTHVTETLKRLDDDEKLNAVILHLGQHRNQIIVSETGMYKIIFQSNKPEAKLFTNWVTKEVLPSIRKTGRYSFDIAADQLIAAKETKLNELKALQNKLDEYNDKQYNLNEELKKTKQSIKLIAEKIKSVILSNPAQLQLFNEEPMAIQ